MLQSGRARGIDWMNRPIDIPTLATADFLASHLPAGAELLEVGCGEGDVAAELARRGCRVTAIDADPEATARARLRGIAALTANWPDFNHAPFDAIAFTRSLHHIHPLEDAARRARELLRPGGVLLVEDFAFDEIDDETIEWFVDALRREPGRSLITEVPSFVTRLLAADNPLAEWRRHHEDHGVSPAAAINAAVSSHFRSVTVEAVPYLYRYPVTAIAETRQAARFIDDLRRSEAQLASDGRDSCRRVSARSA
jgi:SAM-dependent methyltransferase